MKGCSPLDHEHAVETVLAARHHSALSLRERRQRAVAHHALRLLQLLRLLPAATTATQQSVTS